LAIKSARRNDIFVTSSICFCRYMCHLDYYLNCSWP
jgi:hypothetical protein